MDTFLDISRCLYFANNWEEADNVEWNDIYLDKKFKSPVSAKHCSKFGVVKDANNKSWNEHIILGEHVTYDKSRVTNWYPGPFTKSLELKPIRTSATIHSMCV